MKLFFFYSTNDQFSLSVVSVSTGLVQFIVIATIVAVGGTWTQLLGDGVTKCQPILLHSTSFHQHM